jgi:pimeloyl-ACP methyl ester carboxylesterase
LCTRLEREIKVPTLVLAGRDDFLFPPASQVELAAAIPSARLRIIERAGHNAHEEQPAAVIEAVRTFIFSDAAILAAGEASAAGR